MTAPRSLTIEELLYERGMTVSLEAFKDSYYLDAHPEAPGDCKHTSSRVSARDLVREQLQLTVLDEPCLTLQTVGHKVCPENVTLRIFEDLLGSVIHLEKHLAGFIFLKKSPGESHWTQILNPFPEGESVFTRNQAWAEQRVTAHRNELVELFSKHLSQLGGCAIDTFSELDEDLVLVECPALSGFFPSKWLLQTLYGPSGFTDAFVVPERFLQRLSAPEADVKFPQWRYDVFGDLLFEGDEAWMFGHLSCSEPIAWVESDTWGAVLETAQVLAETMSIREAFEAAEQI